MGNGIAEGFQFFVGGFQLGGAFGNAVFQLGIERKDLRFGFFAFGDVRDDGHAPGKLAVGAINWRGGDAHIDQLASFCLANRFTVDIRASGEYLGAKLSVFILLSGWNNRVGFPDHFLGCPPEDLFSGGVPDLDVVIRIQRDDGKRGNLDDRLQAGICIVQDFFGLFAFGNIPGDALDVEGFAVGVVYQGGVQLGWDGSSAFVLKHALVDGQAFATQERLEFIPAFWLFTFDDKIADPELQ